MNYSKRHTFTEAFAKNQLIIALQNSERSLRSSNPAIASYHARLAATIVMYAYPGLREVAS